MRGRISFAVMLRATAVSGCTSWRSVRPPDPASPQRVLAGEVRVTHVDGRIYMLHEARVENDSVIGVSAAGARIALAASEISAIDQRKFSAARTGGLIGGTALAAWVIGSVLAVIAIASIFSP